MDKLENVAFLQCDFEENTKEKYLFFKDKLDVVISDMAANTAGNKSWTLFELISYVQKLLNFHQKF